LLFVEGVRLAEEALRSGLEIEAVVYADDLLRDTRAAELIPRLRHVSHRVHVVSGQLFSGLAETRTPQGIVLLAEKPAVGVQILEANLAGQTPLLIILHGVSNPANAGSILRAAEAAGASGVIATKGTVDLFSPKALRGSMGSAFRLPAWMGAKLPDVSVWLRAQNISTVCAEVRANKTHTDYDWSRACALIVGAEGSGLSEEERALLGGESIRIPMRLPVESLNVAVAAGVVLFEAARQRSSQRIAK
jgi:TrmH family RNA methyltransferase